MQSLVVDRSFRHALRRMDGRRFPVRKIGGSKNVIETHGKVTREYSGRVRRPWQALRFPGLIPPAPAPPKRCGGCYGIESYVAQFLASAVHGMGGAIRDSRPRGRSSLWTNSGNESGAGSITKGRFTLSISFRPHQ
jgi:hypothetical protein